MAASDDELVARFQQLGFSEENIREALLIFKDCPDQAEQAGSWLMENHERDGALAIQQPPAPEAPAQAVLLPPEPPLAAPQMVVGVPMVAAASPASPAAAANQVEAAPPEVQPPPILQDMADEEMILYFQELGFDEENIETALLLHPGDAERAGSWLLAQLEDDNEERAEALPGPLIAAPQGPAATADAVDRHVLAGRADLRKALAKKERREKEEARVRAIKAQEQEEIDRKRARARAQAELNQANIDAAEDAARAGRGAHAEAAEGRAVRAGPSGLQPGPSCAEDPALRIAAARAAAMRAPVDSLTPAAAPSAAAPPAPAEAAATAAARRAAEGEAEEAEAKAKAEADARKRAEPSGAHLTAAAPAAQAPLDAHAKRERMLKLLLQQEGLAPDEAATVAASCKVLETEPLVLEASSDGREMRALLVASARIAVPPPAAPSAVARPVSGAAVFSTPPPPAAAAPAPVSEPAPETLRDIQDKEYAAALAADQEAEVRAATNEAATAASSAVVAEALAGTGPADEERPAEEPDSPVPLSAQELRARRLAVLETGEPRSG
jgi:hypothetical protein